MTPEEMAAYRVEPQRFWEALRLLGGDGYDDMEAANARGWNALSTWGPADRCIGRWPYVIIFWREEGGLFSVVEYVEGDVTQYDCSTSQEREAITEALAQFYRAHP